MINKDEILVSISCITFNHVEFIEECLKGFLNQETNFKFEVLIYDDASTDGTSEIIRKYASKFPDIIKPIIQEENQYSKGLRGINAYYNFPRVKGKYVAMCEGDDYWIDMNKLQKQVDVLEKDKELILCYHNRYVKDFNNILKDVPFRRYNNLNCNCYVKSHELINNFVPQLTLMFRSNVLQEFLSINTSDIYGGDLVLKCFLSTKGTGFYLNFYGAVYRQHGGGVYSSISAIKKNKLGLIGRRQILERFPKVNKKYILLSMCKYSLVLSFLELKNNSILESGKFFLMSFNFYLKYLFKRSK